MEDEVLDNRYKTDYDRSFVPFGPGGAEGFSKMDLVVPKIGSVSNRNNEHGAEGFSKMDLVVPKLNFDNPEEGGGQWTTLMNKIDETDINELWGEVQPLERELASIRELMQKSNSMNINVDEAQRGYIDGEMKKLSDRTQEIQEELGDIYEDIKSNQEDIDSSPIKLSEQLRTKYALSEKNSNPVTYLRNELMSDLGGSMNQLGSQIAATGLIAAANATGVFFGPLGIALSGGVRFAADRYARERETNAEVGGAYKERVEQFQDGYRARNGLSPEAEIPPEIDDYIRLEASKGMNDLRAENMALQWGDYAQSGMGMMPWTLGNTNAGKISSFLMKQMIGSIMEGVEEGVQDVAGQRANNQLEGTLWKKNKNGWYVPNVPGERDEKYGKDGVGLNEFTIKNAKNLFNDYGTVAKAMTGIGDTNGLVSNEFGNSVRAGMIMGVFNPMNVPGLYSEIKGLKNEIREKKNLQGLAKHMTETGQDDARISSYYDAIQNGRVDARIGMLEKEKEVETQVDGKKVTIGKKEFGEEISRLKNARAVWNQIETDASTRKLSELEKAVVFKERLQGAYKMDKILKQVRENESNMNKAEAEYMKTIVDNSGKQLDQNSKDYIKKNAQIETEMIQNETMRTLLMLDKKGLRKISREEKLSIRNNIRLNRESIKRKEKERTEAWGRLEKDKTVDPNLKAMLKDPNQIKSIHDAQKFQDYLSSIGKLNESTSEYASNHQRLMSLHSNPREILREKRKNWNKFRLDRKKEDKANVKAILDSKEDTEKKLSTLEQMKKDRLKELQDSKEINEEEVSFDKAWRQTKDPEEKKLLSLNREKSKLAKVGNSVSKAAELLLGNPFKLGKRTKAYFEKNWNHSLDRDDVITTIDEAIEEIKSGKERTAAVDANRNSGSNSGVGLTQEQNLNDLNQQQPAPVQNQSQTDDVEGSSGVNEGFGVDPDATSGSSEEQQRQEQEDYYNSLGNDSQSGNQNTREPEETGEFDPKNVSRKMSIAVRETVVGNLGIVNSLTEGERRIFSDALTWFNKRFEDFLAKTAKNKTSLDEYGDLNLLSERVQNDLELLMRFGNKILDEAAMLKLGLYTARYKNDLNQRKSNEASEPSENLDVNEVVPFENELVGKVVKELYLRKLIHDEGGRFFFSIMGVTGKKVKMEIGSKTTEEELVTMINKSLKKSSFLYPSDLIEMLQNNNEDAGNGLFSNIRNC